jgi:hypothetical protein
VLSGTADVDALAAGAVSMTRLDAPPVTFEGVAVLQASFEMPYSLRQPALPPGLHPTTPPLLVVLGWSVPDGPWGPFALAQLRVSCRSGVRPRGFVAACAVDSAPAAAALRDGWGLPAVVGPVTLERGYDRVALGAPWIDLVGLDPDPLAPGDVQYSVGTTLAATPRGLRLVQVEPEYEPGRVERVRPRLERFDPGGLPVPLAVAAPVAATIAVGRVTLPALRFLSRPDVPAFEGTERV